MLKRAAFVLVALAVLGLGLMPSGALAQTPPPETSSLLVKLVSGLTADEQAAVVARNGGTETGSIPALRLHVVEVPTVELTDTIARYAADPQVQHVEENRVRRSEFLSNDPFAVQQWALPQIGWDLVFGTVIPTGTARVAVLDTGIDASHPDLAGRVVPGVSILDGGSGLTDSNGHGTWVAGIVAANTDNAAGVAGVAFAGVQLMPVTVLDANGEGRDSDVIAGVIWAADNGADVILMAFSNPGFSPNLQDAIDYAWSRGAVLVAAIGNDAAGTPTFPAGDRGVIGVSGTDPADTLLGYSNYGQAAFLAAPGDNIATTDLGGGYVAISGTSTSSAIVAGVAAFLKAVDPTLTNGMIVGRMARTADPAGTQEQSGNGRVNMARALTDTGRDEIQPAGADPIGDGGPFVGPYHAAARSIRITFAGTGGGQVQIGATSGSVSFATTGSNRCDTPPASGTGNNSSLVTINGTCTTLSSMDNGANVTLNATSNGTSVFAGWSVGAGSFTTCSTSPNNTNTQCGPVVLGGGQNDLTVTFNSNPTTTSISPTSKVVGESSFSMTVNGTNFQAGAVVQFNGSSRTTSGTGTTVRTATIPASDLLTAGTFNITVLNPDGGLSNAQTFTVNKANTTTTINSDNPDPSVVGQAYSVNVTVAAVAPGSGTPTGTVNVADGTGGTCSITLSGGTGSCNLTSTSQGAKTLTAAYQGDSNYNTSSGTASHQVNKANTTTTINSDNPDPSVVGQAYSVNVTVAAVAPGSGTPTGTVNVADGTGGTCSITLSGGTGSCNLTSTSQGAKTLTAAYQGDSNFNTSNGTAAHQVDKAGSTTTITSDAPDPSVVGQAYSVSVTVAAAPPGAGTPTGTVNVADGTGGTCVITLASGSGSCNLTSTSQGAKTLTAAYQGDSNFNTSNGTAAHQVDKAGSTTTITSDAPDPSVVGQAYSVSVTVAAAPPGVGTPSGTVNVADGTGGACVITLASGSGSCNLTSTTAGAKTLTASYVGDTNFNGSSGTAAHQVNKADTTTTINSDTPDPSVVGQAYAVSVTVAAAPPGAGTPSGTVNVADGTGGACVITLASGSGSCNLTSTTAGAKTLTAAYQGDSNFNTSSGTTAHQVDKADTTTTINSDTPDPSVVGQPYAVSVTVAAPPPGAGTPTGTVNVADGTGGTCVITLASGTGSCNLTSTTAGAKTLTAAYQGDSNFNTSSGTTAHQVDKGDTTTTIDSDTPDPSVVGQAYSVTVTVAPVPPGAGTPTGTVNVADGTGGTCVITLASGTGSCNLTSTTAGAKTLTAAYVGDGNFNGSNGTAGHQVDKADTTTTINSDTPDPSVVGQAYSVTVTVAPVPPGAGTPTGTVNVADGTGGTCVITLASGTGSCNLTSTTAGAKTLTAAYQGDSNYNTSNGTAAHQVDKADTTTTITSDTPDPSQTGQPYTVTFTVTVQAPGTGTPTGNVTVTDGTGPGSASCTGTVAAGQCDLTSTTAGPKSLVATYAGDANFNGSVSAGVDHFVDTPPVSFNDVYGVLEGDTLSVGIPGVLANDIEVDAGQTLTAVLVSGPTHASSFTLNPDGSFQYQRNPGFTGQDTFTYQANDGFFDGAVTTVTISVLTPADSPVAENDAYQTGLNAAFDLDVLANDNDFAANQLTVVVESGPAHGVLSTNPDGTLHYVPENGYTGTDSFIYHAHDTVTGLDSNPALVIIAIQPSLVAENDSYTTDQNVALVIGPLGVLANDGAAASAAVETPPIYGTLVLNANGGFTYTPDTDFSGVDSFIYRAKAGSDYSNLALVTIRVRASTTTTITPSANPSKFGQSVTFSVTVAPTTGAGVPTGTVQFKIDTVNFGSPVTLVDGSATSDSISTLTVGNHVIEAIYNGDDSFVESTGSVTQTVQKADTTTTINSDTPDPSVVGQAYTVSVTVAAAPPGAGTPSGTVNVSDGTGGACAITLSGGSGSCNLTSTTAGAKTLTAAYVGDSNFNGSNGTAAHQVDKANTTTTINSDTPDPSVVGQPYAVSVTVAAAPPGAGTPSGTVNVADGTGGTCVITLVGGTGSCNLTSTTAGAKTLTAAYVGDSNFNGSNGTATHQVNKADTTTTINSDTPDPSVVGQPYAVSVTVAAAPPGAGTPTGTVNVADGTGGTCVITLVGGTGSCNLTSTTAGAKTLTATYAGDSNFNGSNGTAAHQVNKADTTTTINSDTPDPSVVGQPYAVSVTVAAAPPGAGTPSGTVNVSDGTGGACAITLSGGSGSCNLTSTTAGAKTLTATYVGDSNFNGSNGTAAHQVDKANTTTTINSDTPDPSVVGQPYAVSVTVAAAPPGAGTPSGTVNVADGTGGTCVITLVGGTGSCNLTSTTAGAKTLTAAYVGDSNFNGSNGTATHQVNKADTTTTINSDTPDPSVVGQPYAVSVTVAAAPPGAGTPSGTVNVSDGTGGACAITLSGGSGSCNLTSTTPGAKTLVATYVGDSNFNGSSSAGAAHQVDKANTTTTINSDTPDPSVVGQPYAVSVTVAAAPPGAGTPSGTVNVSDGTGGTCVVTLVGGTGSCNLTSTTAGAKTLTAAYVGDSNFNGSSGTAAHQVNPANTTTTINSDTPDPSVVGQPYAVSVTVAAAPPGAGTPSGTVNVSDGTGGTCVVTLVGGTGSCNLTSTTAGAKTLTAAYVGDSNFNGSSGTAAHQVNPANTTTTITGDAPDPSVTGQTYAVSVAVAAVAPGTGTPTGTVNVADGTGGACAITLSGGTGSCNLTSTSAGAKTLTAEYVGDSNFNGSNGTAAHQVNKANTTTTITGDSPDPSVTGQAYTVSVSVAAVSPGAGTPGGTVNVSDGTGGTCSIALSGGTGNCNLTSTSVGAKTLTASYVGDSNFNGSNGTAGHQVNKANTTTAITGDAPDPSVAGQPYTVTFTVTVDSPGSGTPTGNVTVTDGTGPGSASCTGTVAAGQCTLTSTTVGSKTLTATYASDSNFNGSNGTATHVVNTKYLFYGFFSPVDNMPVVNKANAGQAIPVKWRITTLAGVAVTDPASFAGLSSYSVTCGAWSSSPEDVVEEYAAGNSGLLNQGNGNWQFNWKTPKGYAGDCRVMILTLDDGSQHVADFQFK